MRRRTPPRPDLPPRPLEAGDKRLAQRILAGDEAAFEAFFDDHFPGLYRFALSRVRDPDLARDVVQNALCKALENLDAFRGEASLAGWLFTICRHEISGHYRRRGRAPDEVELAEETPAVRAALESLPASFSGPQEALEDEELARQVHTTLDHLPPHYGRALEWKYVDGLAVKEIASRLDLGSKAAESLLTRARKAFRDAFSSFGLSFEGWVSSSGLPSTATQPPGIAQEPSVAEEL